MNIDLSRYPLFSDQEKESLTLLSNQGFSNKNYTFQNHNTTYLLRKFILQDRDRELEYKIQTLAYEQGIAAKPFLLDMQNGLMICEFLEGEHKEKFSREVLKQIVQVLKKLHSIKREGEVLSLKTLFTTESKELKEAFLTLAQYPPQLVLCHNDLNPKNLIFSSQGLKLIDWEFASVNDLYFDLATVSVEFDLDMIEEAFLLASYFLFDGWEKEKMEAYKIIYKDLCKQWFKENK